MNISPVTNKKYSTQEKIKRYPFEGRDGLTVSGSTGAIGSESSPIPSRGYPVLGARESPTAHEQCTGKLAAASDAGAGSRSQKLNLLSKVAQKSASRHLTFISFSVMLL